MSVGKRRLLFWQLVLVLMVCFGLAFFHPSVSAKEKEEEKEKRPPRAISIYPEYPGVVVSKDEEVRMDLLVVNKGRSDEDVLVEITKRPRGWKARVKTYSFTVTGVHVPNGETRTLTFLAEPPKNVRPGKYLFRIRGKTKDGKLQSENDLTITVKAEKKGSKSKDILITTSYPVLRGPSDATFEFSIEVENKMDKEAVFSLTARGPSDWDINFKPAYEEKYISSLRLKAGDSRSVAVEVKPPRYAEAGEYPISVTVSSGNRRAEAKLTVVLTGTYKLDVGTTTGLLSLSTQRGKSANISLYVKNTGTAPNHDISFISFKPENWKVKFDPEKIDALKPGDIEQVEVTITPAEEALVGDYSVGLKVKGEKATDDVELRVTVKASTLWGWIGIGIILFVIAGLSVLFIYLGRR